MPLRDVYRWLVRIAVFGVSLVFAQLPLLAQEVPTTDDSGAPPAAIDGVPMCTDHDATRWHPLVERDASGSIVCTFGHEHGADPHALDEVFGPLADAVPGGQEIGYPWLTSPTENSTDPASLSHQPSDERPVLNGKHAFFKWETLTGDKLAAVGIVCPVGTGMSFDRIRMEVHADANAGADIRFHSFYLQAQECSSNDPTYHGQISIGGHFDYGILNGTHADPSTHKLSDVRIPLPETDPCTPGTLLGNAARCPYVASRRTHGASGPASAGSTDPLAALPGYPRQDFTWYGHNGNPDLAGKAGLWLDVSDGIREQDWGPVDPNNPHGPVLFYGPGHNHGVGGIDILDFVAPQARAFPADNPATVNSDGSYSWKGWVDVHGQVQSLAACQNELPSTTCIPTVLTNIRRGEAQFSNDNVHVALDRNDVLGPSGQPLIGYPN